MKVGPIVCVILLAIFVMWCLQSKSSKMVTSYYAPSQSSCSCNKPQTQGVYMPDMNAFPDSSKPNRTYRY